MKKLFTLIAASAMTLGLSAQSITISSVDEGLANDYASGCEIDLDNDGIKELIVGGSPNWPADASIGQVILDAEGNEVFMESRCSWILKWNGTAYEKTQLADDGVIGIRSSVIPADFNNDGLIDIVSCGWWLGANSETAMTGVLINQGDGTYKVTNRFLIGVEEEEYSYPMALCTIKAFDLNNDGYADFMVQGNVDGDGLKPETAGGRTVGRTFMAFLNLGAEGPGEFYDLGLAQGVSHTFGNGNFNVVDFNNDGTPDIFVTGESPDDAVSGWAYFGQLLLGKVTKSGDGNEVSYTENSQFAANHKDVRPLNSSNNGTRAIDYNADGYYDLFLLGWTEQMLDGTGNTQSGWLLPGSANGLTSYQRIPGASEQGIFFLDYGVEGALNYTFTGYHGDATYFDGTTFPGGRSMVFTKNPWAVSARPDAPTAPKAEVDGYDVKLSWTPASTSMKNVTYEYYLKEKTTGRIYNASTSFVGGEKDGVRKVLREGNAYMNTEISLTLPDGTYEWGVQTVNAALRGSTFAKGQDLVVGSGQFNSISTVSTAVAEQAVYTLDGKRVAEPQKGVNIVRLTDGSVKKIMK